LLKRQIEEATNSGVFWTNDPADFARFATPATSTALGEIRRQALEQFDAKHPLNRQEDF
jgi:hypothetical protein